MNRNNNYQKQLEQHRGNIKATWKILNGIIKKGIGKSDYPNYLIKGINTINAPNDIANEFNNFFVNVGPSLANEIPVHNGNMGMGDNIIKQNPHSIFINGVNETEITSIVKNFKNKKSTDSTNLDMAIIKSIIDTIAKPFTHICNSSFLTGTFPNKMKTAKIIPIYKSGDRHQFTNYRPIHGHRNYGAEGCCSPPWCPEAALQPPSKPHSALE